MRRQPGCALWTEEREEERKRGGREGRNEGQRQLEEREGRRGRGTVDALALLKKSSKRRFSRSGLSWKALVMSPRKTERMMQPPRHMRAMPALLSVHLYSLAASRMSMKPWAYEMILDAYRACSRSSMNCFLSPVNGSICGPPMTLDARTRSSLIDDRQRAKTASPMRVTGMPRSSALVAVHLPVPFCDAASRILVTRGTPSSSLYLRMVVVISIRNESRTPLFQVSKTAGGRGEGQLRERGDDDDDDRQRERGRTLSDLLLLHAESALEDVVRLGDELHVAVLDAVVDHLDVVARAGVADPVAARLAVGLGGRLLEDLLDVGPRGLGATGHERRAVARALLAARDARADEEETLSLELLGAAVRVGEVRVAAVDNDVALLEVRLELGDEVVDGRAGLDEEDDLAGALELLAELLDRVGADDRLACCT